MIVVLVPTRSRPARAAALLESFLQTRALDSTKVMFVVDEDDPTLDEYRALEVGPLMVLDASETGELAPATNAAAKRFWDTDCIIGTLNDDMLIRMPGWDRLVASVISQRPAIVYGDDLIHGEHLVTSPFMPSFIPRALGWYALPSCRHLYIDDAWRELGQAAGMLQYLPELVIEHMHPAVGKAEWDDLYRRGNSPETTAHDREAYEVWQRYWLEADADRVRDAALLYQPVGARLE